MMRPRTAITRREEKEKPPRPTSSLSARPTSPLNPTTAGRRRSSSPGVHSGTGGRPSTAPTRCHGEILMQDAEALKDAFKHPNRIGEEADDYFQNPVTGQMDPESQVRYNSLVGRRTISPPRYNAAEVGATLPATTAYTDLIRTPALQKRMEHYRQEQQRAAKLEATRMEVEKGPRSAVMNHLPSRLRSSWEFLKKAQPSEQEGGENQHAGSFRYLPVSELKVKLATAPEWYEGGTATTTLRPQKDTRPQGKVARPAFYAELEVNPIWIPQVLDKELGQVQAATDAIAFIPVAGDVSAVVVLSKECFCVEVRCSNILQGLKTLHSLKAYVDSKANDQKKFLSVKLIESLNRNRMLNESPRNSEELQEELMFTEAELAEIAQRAKAKKLALLGNGKDETNFEDEFDYGGDQAETKVEVVEVSNVTEEERLAFTRKATSASAKKEGFRKLKHAVLKKIIPGLRLIETFKPVRHEGFESWKEDRVNALASVEAGTTTKYALVVQIGSFNDPMVPACPQIVEDGANIAKKLESFGYTVDIMEESGPDFLQPNLKNILRCLRHAMGSVQDVNSTVLVYILSRGAVMEFPEAAKASTKTRIALTCDVDLNNVTVRNSITPDKFVNILDQFSHPPTVFVDTYPINAAPKAVDTPGQGWCSMYSRPGPGSEMAATYPKHVGGLMTYYFLRAIDGVACSPSITEHSMLSPHMMTIFIASRLARRGCTVATNSNASGSVCNLPLFCFRNINLTGDIHTKTPKQYVDDLWLERRLRCNVKFLVRLGHDIRPVPYTGNESAWWQQVQLQLLKLLKYKGGKPAKMSHLLGSAPKLVYLAPNPKKLHIEFPNPKDFVEIKFKGVALQDELTALLKAAIKKFGRGIKSQLGFVPGFSGRTELETANKAVQQFLVDQLLGTGDQAGASRFVRRPKNVFIEVDCTFECFERDWRKMDRLLKQQQLFSVALFHSVSEDPYEIKWHQSATKIQALVRGVMVQKKYCGMLVIFAEEKDGREAIFKSRLTTVSRDFDVMYEEAVRMVDEDEGHHRVHYRQEEIEDRLRIVKLALRSLRKVEEHNRVILEFDERIGECAVYESMARSEIQVMWRFLFGAVHKFQRINSRHAWKTFYLEMEEYRSVLEIRNKYRRWLTFFAVLEPPKPPSSSIYDKQQAEDGTILHEESLPTQ